MHNLQLHRFFTDNLFTASESLFEQLGFALNIRSRTAIPLSAALKDFYKSIPFHDAITETYFLGAIDDTAHFVKPSEDIDLAVDQVEQSSPGEKYNGLLLFALKVTDYTPTRTEIANLTRAFNRRSRNVPVVVLLRYDAEERNLLTFATSERLPYKQAWRQGEKIGKISMLKDIDLNRPHAAHQRILWNLGLHHLREQEHKPIASFDELYDSWRNTLDIQELNKRFFRELTDWFFWAAQHVSFPEDLEPDKDMRNAKNLIRLLTRIIFIWFMKEKGFVPEHLFDRHVLAGILKNFLLDWQSSTYYQAILQNLFFATLNQNMAERAFAKEGTFFEHKKEHGLKTLFRYADQFAISPDEALALFAEIPFLNGGLFDCLDKEDEQGKVRYVDGFSRNPKKRAQVPDRLFFTDDALEVDLTDSYDPRAATRIVHKVRGLCDILHRYKFTVAENTPIEEEVALDPELLGKVFENLLASYNPETKTTARKQTGSFYTPREIVNYMVDESLKVSLKQALLRDTPGVMMVAERQADMFGNAQRKGQLVLEHPVERNRWNGREKDLDKALDDLLSYDQTPLPFDERERRLLIAAINRCKILDPACGSGAFPMGALHKLVHLLYKLDPDNRLWKQEQKERLIGEKIAELKRDHTLAEQFSDERVREQAIQAIQDRLQEIEAVFDREHQFDDYARKLYLIENCIYGVDIQAIAVQIAKLRCFISLIIDQKKQPEQENLGLRALPNLETKFVAADALIALDSPKGYQMALKNREIQRLENELKDLRHRYFSAKSRSAKLRYQQQDHDLRRQLADRLAHDGWDTSAAQQLAAFDPYDQNASSSFFAPEWMFGLADGFDIVIGNPPYIQIQKFDSLQKARWQEQQYDTFNRMGDIYCLFYEKGYRLLREKGYLCFISSNKWMRTDYGKALRKFFADQTNPIQLIDFGRVQVFDATVDTNILLLQHAPNAKQLWACRIDKDFKLTESLTDYVHQHRYRLKQLSRTVSWIVGAKDEFDIKGRVECQGIPLKDWKIDINYGIKTGFNKAFVVDSETKAELIAKDPKNAEILKPFLQGRDIQKWGPEFADQWLINAHNGLKKIHLSPIHVEQDYPVIFEWLKQFRKNLEKRYDKGEHWTNLRNCSYLDTFEQPKIMYPNMTKYLPFVYDEEQHFYSNDKSFIITGESLKYLVAFFNSKLFKYCFLDNFPELQGGTRELRKVFFDKIPVKQVAPEEQRPFERLVDYIVFLKQQPLTTSTEHLMPVFFEQIIDGLLYELYLPESVKKSKWAFAQYLHHLPDLAEQPNKMRFISELFTQLYHKDHPIRNSVFFIDSIVEIGMIEKAVKS